MLTAAGIALLAAAVWMPQAWYVNLPRAEGIPPAPISGLLLFRLTLAIEGLLLLWVSRRAAVRVTPRANEHPKPDGAPDALGRRAAIVSLTGITFVAFALRLWRIDADLWLDEIAPLVTYRDRSVLEVVATYLAANNHLLNTLLVKASVAVFGEREWAVRLPAVLFGTAAVPLLYWVARFVFDRAASLGAALLLAFSYHHIFFSQNARGYTAYVFFSVLSAGLLCRALADPRLSQWVLYVGAMTLNTASLLLSGFVFAAHVLIAGGAVLARHWRGLEVRSILRASAAGFGVAALLSFQVYALILPQAYMYTRTVYRQADSGFSLLSAEFAIELARALLAGAGLRLGWMAIPLLGIGAALGAFGFARLLRRGWILTSALALPLLLTVAAVLAGRLTVSPRFFLLALPLASLVAVACIEAAAERVRRAGSFSRRGGAVLRISAACMLALLHIPGLFGYYEVPKQPYVSSAQYLRHARGPRDLVVFVHLAEEGYRYYGPRFGLEEGRGCVYLRTRADFDRVVRAYTGGRVLLVTTFPRALRLELPDLAAAIEAGWRPQQVFPATVGDGDITIWTPR